MFKRILVPLDGSPASAVALPPARTLARATGAEVVLVRAVPASLAARSEEAEARQTLGRIVRELAASDLRVEAVVPIGDAAQEILGEVKRRGADLVVMATHGRAGLGRALLGSVAERVLSRSPVPVMLLRPGGRRLQRLARLLVPVDGTPGSSLALALARSLGLATNAQVVLAQVVAPLPRYGEGLYIEPDWEEETRQAAQAAVDRLAHALQRAGVAAEARARIGQVAPTIVALADEADADVIVMSTHALTGPIRALLGSVADEVVRTASRPVLLLRQGAAPRAGEEVEAEIERTEVAARPA